MSPDDTALDSEPKISLRQISASSEAKKGAWQIAWRVENLSQHSLRLDAARFPHGQFKAGEQQFDSPLLLGDQEAAIFESTIKCEEPPGAIVENAFVIFTSVWKESRWRIFVRLRVTVDDKGQPNAVTELITTQKIGFSWQLRSDG
jgi:hypothetical protein